MRRLLVVLSTITVSMALPASAAPIFEETFENPGRTPSYLTASGKWLLMAGQPSLPAAAAGPNVNGWIPVYGENVSIKRHLAHKEAIPGGLNIDGNGPHELGSELGGDYWNSAYPIGVIGEFYFGTADVRPTKDNPWNFNPVAGVGTPDAELDWLTADFQSQDIDLTGSNARYVAFTIGGRPAKSSASNQDLVFVSVEGRQSCRETPQTLSGVSIFKGGRRTFETIAARLTASPSAATENNKPALVAPNKGAQSGSVIFGDERMQLVIIDLWGQSAATGLAGNPRANWCKSGGRIRMRDMSQQGHLNVDSVVVGGLADIAARFQEAPFGAYASSALVPTTESDRPAAVYGIADIHTHWMSHMGSGAEPLPAVTPLANRKSLAALQTRMGAMSGLPFQRKSGGYFELCPSDWVNSDGNLICPARFVVSTCTMGTCTTNSDIDRDRLALAACDRGKHQNRGETDEENIFNDENYNSVSASQYLMHVFAEKDGSSHVPMVGYEELLNQATHGQYGYNWDLHKFVVPERPFLSKIHQQMYWKWLKRAWQGGLRVLVSDVQHSLTLDTLMHNFWDLQNSEATILTAHTEWAHVGHASDEQYAVQRQVCALKKLAAVSEIADFARIAYTPGEARRYIADGKLAIVLGAELATSGQLRAGGPAPSSYTNELDFLRWAGIRKITPIHQFDNELGGAAVFDGVLTLQNDAFGIDTRFVASGNCATLDNFSTITAPGHKQGAWNRWIYGLGEYAGGIFKNEDAWEIRGADVTGHLSAGQIACTLPNTMFKQNGAPCADEFECAAPTHYFQIATGATDIAFNIFGSLAPDFIGDDNLTKRVAWWKPPLGAVTNNQGFTVSFEEGVPTTDPLQKYGAMALMPGHINAKGLTSRGADYAVIAMSRGMLIDVEHMGQTARDDLQPWLFQSGCTNPDLAVCQARAYPIIATHSDLRWSTAWTTNERQLREKEVQQIMRLGGIVGLSTGYERHNAPIIPKQSAIWDTSTLTTCPGSPTDFALKYLAYISAGEQAGASMAYVVSSGSGFTAHVTPRPPHWAAIGAALGTDFNGFASQMGPRHFGASCYGAEDLDLSITGDPMLAFNQAAEHFRQNGVYYKNDIGGVADDSIAARSKAPTDPSTPAQPDMKRMYFDKNDASAFASDVIYRDEDGDVHNVPPVFRGFDFNYVGHANIGLTPDMLQNMVNAMRTDPTSFMDMRYQMRYLFRGAEDFIEAWEKSVAACVRTGSTACTTPGTTIDAGTCDMWPSDADAVVSAPTNTTPSCMFRCGEKLTYGNNQSCRCYISQAEIDDHDSHPDDLCDDFKPWCQWYYNGADDPSGGNVNISVP